MSRALSLAVGGIAAVFFGCFFAWPIVQTVRGAFFDAGGRWTLEYVWEIVRNRVYLEGLQNAFLLALASTALTVALAVPLAWMADRFDFPAKRALLALLLVPMVLPPFVGRSRWHCCRIRAWCSSRLRATGTNPFCRGSGRRRGAFLHS